MPDGVAAKKAVKPKPAKSKAEKNGGTQRRVDGWFTRFRRFLRESYIEVVKKSEWPTWPELQKSTWIVLFAVIVIGLWIAGIDRLLSWLTAPLLKGK